MDTALLDVLVRAMLGNTLPEAPKGLPATFQKLWKPCVLAGHGDSSRIAKVRGQVLGKLWEAGGAVGSKRGRTSEGDGTVGDTTSAVEETLADFIVAAVARLSDSAGPCDVRQKALLEMRHLGLGDVHTARLLGCISPPVGPGNGVLTTLDLECNALTGSSVLLINTAIVDGSLGGLRNLYLASNKITGAAIKDLVDATIDSSAKSEVVEGEASPQTQHSRVAPRGLLTQIEDLGLTNNALGFEGLHPLLSFLAVSAPQLKRLHLNHVAQLTDDEHKDCVQLCETIATNEGTDMLWFKQNTMAKVPKDGSGKAALANERLAL